MLAVSFRNPLVRGTSLPSLSNVCREELLDFGRCFSCTVEMIPWFCLIAPYRRSVLDPSCILTTHVLLPNADSCRHLQAWGLRDENWALPQCCLAASLRVRSCWPAAVSFPSSTRFLVSTFLAVVFFLFNKRQALLVAVVTR